MKTGVELIAEERQRQVEKEFWTPGHDDFHNNNGELALAAAAYCITETGRSSTVWPWEQEYWKPTPDNRIKELVKAGALIAAEIDRLQRK